MSLTEATRNYIELNQYGFKKRCETTHVTAALRRGVKQHM